MNGKIRELAKLAGMSFVYEYDSSIVMDVEDLEKFAELIIQEAMDIVRDEVSFHSDWACADNAIIKVKEHFGVE